MPDDPEPDPVLQAADALRAAGVAIEPTGDDLEGWRVGDFTMSDADLVRLAVSRGLMEADGVG